MQAQRRKGRVENSGQVTSDLTGGIECLTPVGARSSCGRLAIMQPEHRAMSHHISSRNPLWRLASSLGELRAAHRERHRPTGFGFLFADRVDYLDPQRWD